MVSDTLPGSIGLQILQDYAPKEGAGNRARLPPQPEHVHQQDRYSKESKDQRQGIQQLHAGGFLDQDARLAEIIQY